jgi:hypothetical protein
MPELKAIPIHFDFLAVCAEDNFLRLHVVTVAGIVAVDLLLLG